MIRALFLAAILLFQAPTEKPIPPIPLSADETQAIQSAFTVEQTAQMSLERAQAQRVAVVYRLYAEHALKPSEWDLMPDGKGGFVFVKKDKK
jgi:hypothetical protein